MRKTLLFAGLLALLAWPSVARAQSLGDVARAEEARRKAVKQPAKVYTNDDLKRNGGESTPAPAAQPAASAKPAEPSNGGPPKADTAAAADDSKSKKDEAYWRNRITSARDALAHDKVLIDAVQSRVNALTTEFVNTDDPARRAVIEGNRKTALAEMDRLTKDVDNQTKAIADTEEEARKASVPAGWLR
ncbi:MAG TPA: hypothetical protein VGZ27_17115 [Vicinamibacterales bacterium]|jgi:hypothetical protein|nr:hypothetical protein [Vicinamibacterales bacterium]